MTKFLDLDPKQHILIKDAHMHNLKHIDVAIPRNQLVVITGLSGSGKSTLAFDTLFAEGQRRYVESLSAYARQFLGQMDKPAVEYIKGLSPAVAIEQKVSTNNPRSTVGTTSEIYEYIKLLYSRIGKTFSPISGKEVKRHTVKDVVAEANSWEQGQRFIVCAPIQWPQDDLKQQQELLNMYLQQGYSRLWTGSYTQDIQELLQKNSPIQQTDMAILIDRLSAQGDNKEANNRLADSVQTAFHEGQGSCTLYKVNTDDTQVYPFSNRFELDGMEFVLPTPSFFAFNNPYGACSHCGGFGSILGIDEDLVIPNKSLSLYDEAVACWRGASLHKWKQDFIMNCNRYNFPIATPYWQLTTEEKDMLWNGRTFLKGINTFFEELSSNMHKIQNRILLARYRGKSPCPDCHGTRLRKDASYVKINGKSIQQLLTMPLNEVQQFFEHLTLSAQEQAISERLVTEISKRLTTLINLGLGYLTLNRQASTLSGGEAQRINLSTSLASSLVGAIYVLDEPSIGLHSRDTQKLIQTLHQLRDIGNTVVVVEHDEEIMAAADYIIDLGPKAGLAGGDIMFAGNLHDIMHSEHGLTAAYLQGKKVVAPSPIVRSARDHITVEGALSNNLKNLIVKFPLKTLTVVTGVSGSGKSTLVKDVFYPALSRYLGDYSTQAAQKNVQLSGELDRLHAVEMIDQKSASKSSRSNAATYLKAWDDIRQLYASTRAAQLQGLLPGDFSFNIAGGRCEACEGEGAVKVEMQFMADIYLKCDTCRGQRFQDNVLDIRIEGKNVYDLLNMSIDEVVHFLETHQNTYKQMAWALPKLYPLQEVGLGYIHLGQSSNTLSGGEAQRLKLAYYLAKKNSTQPMLFIFDEPTTGLHFHDIDYLLKAFYSLIELGHSVIVIEHHLDIIRNADWVIDMGPEGGDKGGYIMFQGLVKDLLKANTHTAMALKAHLHNK